jgi:hypothetical protein
MSDSSRWITVGELAEAFTPETYAPLATPGLAETTLDLHGQDNQATTYRFKSGTQLSWARAAGDAGATFASENYVALALRDGLYFVDFLPHEEPATSVTLILDLTRSIATTLRARLPGETEASRPLSERIAREEELTAVATTFTSARLGAPFSPDTPRHLPSSDLVGRRVEYTYSPHERYEHVYLNERFYTWHCLQGREKGLADTDRCHYFSLAEELYLFVWREKIVPTLGVVIVDFREMRTRGKICGFRGDGSPELANFLVGAHAKLVNVTSRV